MKKKFIIQYGFKTIKSIDNAHVPIEIPIYGAEIIANSWQDGFLAMANTTFDSDEPPYLAEIICEVDASDLGGTLGEMANNCDMRKIYN